MNVSDTDRVSLDALCELIAVQRHPADLPEARYVGLEHVPSGRMRWASVGRASDMQSHKFTFQRNDVLYGKLRPYLDKAVLADSGGLCTTELLVLRAKPGVSPRFLACVAHAPDFIAHAMAGVTGAHHPRTSWSHIAAFQLPSYDLDAQQTIAALLWRVHDLIAACETSTGAAQALKQVSMRELFTRGLRGEPQKETDFGTIPESWRVTTFSEIREWLQYGTSIHCTLEPRRFPVLRIPNVEPGRVNACDLKYCDLSEEDAEKYMLESGDLLFIRTNGVLERLGSCAVYDGEPQKALFASYLIRARLKPGIDSRYVAYFYGSERGTSLVAGRATPAADGKYNLNTGTIDSLPLPLPPTLEEQREIVAILDAIDRKIDLHQLKRAVLDDLFKALLHKLMTGEIAVDALDLSALDRAPVPQGAPA
ncbi:MAG: restriction endonuclease subunit S [Rubrivivax sp.]|nr:restriction endonuclease subunit S [Rubrivivax sp.]